MGNVESFTSYLGGTIYIEERQIRRFEMTDLINQDSSEYLKKFSWVYPLICVDSDNLTADSAIENIFKDNFNLKILKFVQNGNYFKKNINGNTIYDLNKIRILIFLLTTNTNDVNYSDKVIFKNYNLYFNLKKQQGSFLFSLFRDDQNEILDESVKHDSKELAEVIQIMFEISCLELYRFYLDEMQINLTNQIVKMQGVKERCIQEIYKRLFGYDKNTKTNFQAVDPQNILEIFKGNKLVNLIKNNKNLIYIF